MRNDDFEQALDRYGGDLARWPATLRAEGEALIAGDPKAATMAAIAARRDSLLTAAVEPLPVDTAFLGRIMAEASGSAPAAHEAAIRPTPRFAAFAGAVMVLFLATGYVAGLLVPSTDNEDVFAGLMFGNSRTLTDIDSTAASSGGAL